jgi:hypothetical protein
VGITATPWQWLLDQKTINYAQVTVKTFHHGHTLKGHSTVNFKGEISPFIIFLAVPALLTAFVGAWRDGDQVAALGACWCLGAFIPFVVQSQVSGRITYLYYMVIVMPGIYLVTAWLFSRRWMPHAAVIVWAILLVYSFLNLYPLRTLL